MFRNVSVGDNSPSTVVFPPSPQLNYFEIKIVAKRSSNDCPEVGIGVGPSNYHLTSLPGWGRDSVGYHSDDGKVYHSYPYSQRILGPTCAVGDVMGCGVVFEDLEGHATVWFTKNGSVVGRPERAKHLPDGLCFLFGSRHGGEEVLYLGHGQWTPTGVYEGFSVWMIAQCMCAPHESRVCASAWCLRATATDPAIGSLMHASAVLDCKSERELQPMLSCQVTGCALYCCSIAHAPLTCPFCRPRVAGSGSTNEDLSGHQAQI